MLRMWAYNRFMINYCDRQKVLIYDSYFCEKERKMGAWVKRKPIEAIKFCTFEKKNPSGLTLNDVTFLMGIKELALIMK